MANTSSLGALHPYRRAAIWAAVLTVAAWGAWWLPTKLFHASGAPPAGYLTALGHHLLLPGLIVSLFIFGLEIFTGLRLILWQCTVVVFSWLFYFGLLSLFVRLRRGHSLR